MDAVAVLSQMRAGFRAPARPPPAGPCPCIRPLDSFLSARPPGRRATARLQVPSPRGPVSHVPFPLQPVLLTSHPNREQTPTCKHPRDTSSPPGPGGKDRSVPNPVAWPPRAWGAFPEDTRCPLPQWAPAAPHTPRSPPSLHSAVAPPCLPSPWAPVSISRPAREVALGEELVMRVWMRVWMRVNVCACASLLGTAVGKRAPRPGAHRSSRGEWGRSCPGSPHTGPAPPAARPPPAWPQPAARNFLRTGGEGAFHGRASVRGCLGGPRPGQLLRPGTELRSAGLEAAPHTFPAVARPLRRPTAGGAGSSPRSLRRSRGVLEGPGARLALAPGLGGGPCLPPVPPPQPPSWNGRELDVGSPWTESLCFLAVLTNFPSLRLYSTFWEIYSNLLLNIFFFSFGSIFHISKSSFWFSNCFFLTASCSGCTATLLSESESPCGQVFLTGSVARRPPGPRPPAAVPRPSPAQHLALPPLPLPSVPAGPSTSSPALRPARSRLPGTAVRPPPTGSAAIIPLRLANFHSGFALHPSCFLRMSSPTS